MDSSLASLLRAKPGLGLGLLLSLAFVATSALAPWLAPHDPTALHVGPSLSPPSAACWFGTDVFGRDLFSRVLWGGRISLTVGALSTRIAFTLGCGLGAVAGYFGGWTDRLVTGAADLCLSLPRLVLVLAVLGMLRVAGAASLAVVVVVLGLTGWMSMARMVRAHLLGARDGTLAKACRALGLPTWRILLVHLLPSALRPVLVHATLGLGQVVLIEASLSFLGLGVPQPLPSWGSSIALGRDWMLGAWWLATFPSLAVVLAVVGLQLLADALAGDPPGPAPAARSWRTQPPARRETG